MITLNESNGKLLISRKMGGLNDILIGGNFYGF